MHLHHTGALRLALVGAAALAFTTLGHAAADASCSKKHKVDIGSGKTKMVPRVGKPERVFGGKVLTGAKRFPTWARSVNGYIHSVKKNRKDKFWEDKAEKQWKVHYIAFFKAPHDDVEVKIRIYDLTGGNKQMLSSFEQFVDRCSTSYASDVVLKRERFGVNKQLMITVESTRGFKVLAAGKFKILGEAEKFTGKADFSDEIAPKKDEPDEDALAAAQRANNDRANAAKQDELPPEKEEKPIDYTSDKWEKTPDLDHEDGMDTSPSSKPKSNRGCGCSQGRPEDLTGGALLILAGLWFERRRRRALAPSSDR